MTKRRNGAVLGQPHVFFLNIALGISLIILTIFLLQDVISVYSKKQDKSKTYLPLTTNVNSIEQKKQIIEYSSILKNNPFGFDGGEIKLLNASSNIANNVQRVDILLIGTVVGPRELSYAVFKDKSGQQEVFKIGDAVFDIGMLYSVKKDKVLVKRAERLTEIPFAEDVKVTEVKGTAPTGIPAFAQGIGGNAYIVDQRKVQEAISNPAQLMTDARLRPNVSDGKKEGFILSEVKPGGIYYSLGLRNNDILLRINEYDISDPEKALQAFTALKGLDRVQVDLLRAGSRMTMTYQIK
ncbi:MAG: type II secretion system protein N [Nitrospirota bacterium]